MKNPNVNQKRTNTIEENNKISNIQYAENRITDTERMRDAGQISQKFADEQLSMYRAVIARNSR